MKFWKYFRLIMVSVIGIMFLLVLLQTCNQGQDNEADMTPNPSKNRSSTFNLK
jgi:hypothetical protein